MADKVVTVTVTVNSTNPYQRVYTISVDQEPVMLDASVEADEGIEWKIVSESDEWTFTKDKHGESDGITIKNQQGKFKDKKGSTNKKHRWERQTTDYQLYRYTISVTNETATSATNPRTTLSWDPSIQNN